MEIKRILNLSVRFLIDFGVILLLCTAFVFAKHIYYEWDYVISRKSFFNALYVTSFGSALTLYPAFLIGIRIKKPYKWFFVLSWLTFVIIWCWSLSGGQNLTYSVGGHVVKISGSLTSFGVWYELFSPKSFMALLASFLFVKSRFGKELSKKSN